MTGWKAILNDAILVPWSWDTRSAAQFRPAFGWDILRTVGRALLGRASVCVCPRNTVQLHRQQSCVSTLGPIIINFTVTTGKCSQSFDVEVEFNQ